MPRDDPSGDALGLLADPEMGLRTHSVRQSSIAISGQLLLAGVQFVSTLILARLLLPSDFGLIAMVAALVAFLSLFRDIGLMQAAIQTKDLTPQQATGMFWVSVAVTAGVALATGLSAPLVAVFYGQPELIGITLAYAAILLVGGLGIAPQAILSRQMQFRRIVVGEVFAGIVGMLVGIAVALRGGGYWALVMIPATRALLTTSYLWIVCPWTPGWPRRDSGIGPMIGFGSRLSAANVATFLSRNADDVLVGWRWGAAALGQYAAAYRVLLMPLAQVSTPLSRIAIPVLTRLNHDSLRYRDAYLRMVRVLATVTSPPMGIAIVGADWIIRILLGPGWEQAAEVLVWLALAGLTQPIANSTGWLFVTQGRVGDHLRWSIVSALVTVGSIVVGLPYGPVGVASAYAISGLLIRLPLLVSWVGRRGPVTSMDLVRVSLLPLAVSLWAMGSAMAVRWALPDIGPVVGIGISTILTLLGATAIASVTHAGRDLRSDIGTILADLRSTHQAR